MPDLLIVLVVILIIVVMLRGPKTLPELGAMLGRGTKNLKDELAGDRTDENDSSDTNRPA